MPRPSIAHIVDDPNLGGVMRVLDQLAESALGQKYAIDVITLNSRGVSVPRLDHDAIVVHYTASWRKLPHLALLRVVNASKPFFIQEHSYSAGFEAGYVPDRARFHGMLRLAYGVADRVIANSHAVADWMLDGRLVAPQRLISIPQSWDVSPLMDIPPPRPSAAAPITLGAYGRFHEQKGFDDLIRAMARIPPEVARLRIGGTGPLEPALRALAAALPHVEFVGQVTDLRSFLAACDAVVIPSRWEPFGLVCLEAKAAARPVIASAVDGLIEQVRECGTLVPPGDADGLVRAILDLPSADLDLLGRRGRADVTDAWDRFVGAWIQVLDRAFASSGAPPAEKRAGRFNAMPIMTKPGQNR